MLKIITDYSFGVRVEIVGDNIDEDFNVQISAGGENRYSAAIKVGMWCSTNYKYYLPYEISVISDSQSFFERLDLSGKTIIVLLDIEDISDVISSCKIVDEFRKKHGCDIVCVTSHGYLCSIRYPDIEFVVLVKKLLYPAHQGCQKKSFQNTKYYVRIVVFVIIHLK